VNCRMNRCASCCVIDTTLGSAAASMKTRRCNHRAWLGRNSSNRSRERSFAGKIPGAHLKTLRRVPPTAARCRCATSGWIQGCVVTLYSSWRRCCCGVSSNTTRLTNRPDHHLDRDRDSRNSRVCGSFRAARSLCGSSRLALPFARSECRVPAVGRPGGQGAC